MKLLLVNVSLLSVLAGSAMADTNLMGTITIYDQTSGTYANKISTPNCSATNGSCGLFTSQIALSSSGTGSMSWSVGTYDVVKSGFFTYNNHFTYPDGVASIAECQWNVTISRSSNTAPWTGTSRSYSTSDSSVNYYPICSVNSLSVNGSTGNFTMSVTFSNK